MDDEMLITSVEKQKKRRHKHSCSSKNPKKKQQQQQQQLKVVYISNPVRVNTSAAKFRALVQQLTGQDAADDLPPVPHGSEGIWQKDIDVVGEGGGIDAMEDHVVLQVPSIHHHPGTGTSSENSNLIFEDAYVPQLQESFPAAGILPSNMWGESINIQF